VNGPSAALLDARYQVGPVLARGGMSTVYRGTDIRLDRPVAI
jgi:serine/threonine-protein kinase